jgi:hypothetical protein
MYAGNTELLVANPLKLMLGTDLSKPGFWIVSGLPTTRP